MWLLWWHSFPTWPVLVKYYCITLQRDDTTDSYMNGPRASYQPDQPNSKRDDYSTHSSPSTLHPPLDATLFALRRHVKRRCTNYAVCTYGMRTYARTGGRTERWGKQDGVSGGSRIACVSSVSFLSYPFRTPFSFFWRLPDLSAGRKREREPTNPSDEHSRTL